jgi:hypothetical protein
MSRSSYVNYDILTCLVVRSCQIPSGALKRQGVKVALGAGPNNESRPRAVETP